MLAYIFSHCEYYVRLAPTCECIVFHNLWVCLGRDALSATTAWVLRNRKMFTVTSSNKLGIEDNHLSLAVTVPVKSLLFSGSNCTLTN